MGFFPVERDISAASFTAICARNIDPRSDQTACCNEPRTGIVILSTRALLAARANRFKQRYHIYIPLLSYTDCTWGSSSWSLHVPWEFSKAVPSNSKRNIPTARYRTRFDLRLRSSYCDMVNTNFWIGSKCLLSMRPCLPPHTINKRNKTKTNQIVLDKTCCYRRLKSLCLEERIRWPIFDVSRRAYAGLHLF